MRFTTLHLGLVLLAAGACASGSMEGSDTMAASKATVPQAEQPAPAPLTDANIAAIVVVANSIDIENGKLAIERATNAEIRKFAQTMITDHTGVNKAAVDLVTRLKVTPMESPTSSALAASANETRASLATRSGSDFDRAYIANEVAYHRAVLATVDDALIPSAQNAELRSLLLSVRPAFVAHLQHAESLQQRLAN